MSETNYCSSLSYSMWNAVPRLCNCLSYDIESIFHIAKYFCISKECHLYVSVWYHVDEIAKAHQTIHENKMGKKIHESENNNTHVQLL